MSGTINSLTSITGSALDVDADGIAVYDQSEGITKVISPRELLNTRSDTIVIACSNNVSTITTGTGKETFRWKWGSAAFSAVSDSLTSAAVSGTITVDINKNGTTILSTKLTIDAGETTSTTAAVPAVISVSGVVDDDEISIDVDDDASGDAVGLKVYLTFVQAA